MQERHMAADQTFATTGVTMSASAIEVVYGQRVTLSGIVSGGQTGDTVTLFAQPYGATAFHSIATVLTAAGGAWSYAAKPSIRTEYQAASGKTTPSSHAIVGVHPFVSLRAVDKGARFTTHVAGGSLVRRTHGEAAAVVAARPVGDARREKAERRLDDHVPPEAPEGKVPVGAVVFSVNQAGAGFLGGLSRTITSLRH